MNKIPKWDIASLQTHLQAAVDLEFWTIPFYLSALYSIKNPASEAYQLIQSVAYQEMLHVELAANLANAYGLSPKFDAPVYEGQAIPHLNFALDIPNPVEKFSPYTAQIGGLDLEHINAMCLIEYPEWRTGHKVNFCPVVTEYGSIGEFYDAVELGAAELVECLVGGHNQVNYFQNFYRLFTVQTVIADGTAGLPQAINLIKAIRTQGAGGQGTHNIPEEYRNTADDIEAAWQHFKKFKIIRELPHFPETYHGVANPDVGSKGYDAQQILIENFTAFRTVMEEMFSGKPMPAGFGAQMATLGGNILNCWKNGAIPKFSA